MPIVLTVNPNDEALGGEALDLALAVCTLPVLDKWAGGELDTDGSVICWSGYSIQLSQKSFETIGDAAHTALACIEQQRMALEAIRDCPAVRDMTLFLRLSCPRGTEPNARLPRRLTEIATEFRMRVQAHAADGSVIV